MRSALALRLALLLAMCAAGVRAGAQACTGLCLQQITCPNGGTTSLSGTVYAPNNIDPLPYVLVYIPNSPVAAFTPGVSCAVAGQPPSGSPLVGTTTAVDGTFTIRNVPVGTDVPLVIQTGRWRRQVTVPATSACTSTSFSTRFPQNQGEGDIPKIAVVTGSADDVECVLRKVGVADTEFTDASGSGRINLFPASGGPGAEIDPQTPSGDTLLGTAATLNGYDVLMLPCESAPFVKQSTQLANLVQYANAGGRVYASHYSYDWLFENAPFNTVANWAVDQPEPPDGTATISTDFVQGQTLSQWLGVVGATTTPGQVAISTLRHDLNGVNAPTQTWLTLNNAAYGNPVMQFTFDTPVNSSTNACGRVLFNEYHVENPTDNRSGQIFPAECNNGPMSAQEKLLEYSLFDLTGDGNPPSLSPLTANFGSEALSFSSPTQRFLWTNNTIFPVTVSSVTASTNFSIASNQCQTVPVGGTCEIDMAFAPTALGATGGTLTVVANTGTLTAALTGTGVSPLTVSAASLGFGNVDVGASASQSFTLTNQTPNGIGILPPTTTGDFNASTNCPGVLAAQSSCTLTVVFTPTATGARTGTVNVNAASTSSVLLPVAQGYGAVNQASLTGNGVDFALAVGPASAQTVAGLSATTTSTTSPIAGFDNAVTIACTTTAPASVCSLANSGFTPVSAVADGVTITTTSQYAVIGYSGFGAGGRSLCALLLAALAGSSGLLLLRRRRRMGGFAGLCTLAVCALALSFVISGCSGKYPAQNAPYTPAGTYTYTVTATDGFLKHSAVYTLVVSAQ